MHGNFAIITHTKPNRNHTQLQTKTPLVMIIGYHGEMMMRPFLVVLSICIIHLDCSVQSFVPRSQNIPFAITHKFTLTTDTALRLTNDDDFASFASDSGGDEGKQLASEFYQELENRRKQGEETYTVSEPKPRKMFSAQSRQNTNPQKPAVSAGLFSGGGSTVYSSGRSISAEIDILNRSMAEDSKEGERWSIEIELSPEQVENLLRFLGSSLIVVAIAGAVLEVSSGGIDSITLFNEGGISSTMVSVTNGDVFWGDEAAWLMKESTSFAKSITDAVQSVEGIVLR